MPATDPSSLGWLADFIAAHGFGVGLCAVFFGGMALNLTPCVYPMVPVTLGFFSSQAAGATRRAVGLALIYVLGIALSYAALGFAAAKTGALFGAWMQRPAVLFPAAGIAVALAFSMFGAYELRAPSWLIRRIGQAGQGLGGAFVMGLLVGVVAAPCVGPFILGLLLMVSRLANPAAGFALLFALGLGMGAPYVLLALAAHRLGRLPKGGAWLVWIKQALGAALLGVALMLVRPLLPPALVRALAVLLLAGAGAALGFAGRLAGPRGFRGARRVVGAMLILSAAVVAWPREALRPGPTWTPYTEAALEEAQRSGRLVIVDMYADWCVPCVEMDHSTFRNPEVVAALASVLTLRVDATRDLSPDAQALVARHRIFGAPTVLFFDRTGRERGDLRLTGFAAPDEFLKRLRGLTG